MMPRSQHLDGGKTYRLHLPAPIPAKDFWSLVVYDSQTRSMLQTDQRFPSLSSQNADLIVNSDASVDVYFSPEPPLDEADQLGADRSRQGMVYRFAPVWTPRAVVRQVRGDQERLSW